MRRQITGRGIWLLAAVLGGMLWLALLPALVYLFYNLGIWRQEMDAGENARRQREYAAAARHYALAIQAAQRLGYERGNQYLARSLGVLAYICEAEGREARAEELYREALAIQEQARGRDDPSEVPLLYALAYLLRERGRYGQSETIYRRILAIQEAAHGPDSPA